LLDVLLLDYSPTTRRATRTALVHAGFNVIVAETVELGLAALRRGWPDAVLVNADIPAMNAEALCEVLHRENPHRKFPIFIVVPPRGSEPIPWADSIPACFFLEHPLSPDQIVARLADALNRAHDTRRTAH
jgi:DNA-binding response OmpR family regulator